MASQNAHIGRAHATFAVMVGLAALLAAGPSSAQGLSGTTIGVTAPPLGAGVVGAGPLPAMPGANLGGAGLPDLSGLPGGAVNAPNLSSLPLPGSLGIGGLPGSLGLGLGSPLSNLDRLSSSTRAAVDQRTERLKAQVRANPAVLDSDPRGAPVVRNQVILVQPSAKALATARDAGFRVVSEESLEGLGLKLVILSAPAGVTTKDAVAAIKRADPQAAFDFNHLYAPSGQVGAPAPKGPVSPSPAASTARMGLIDTGVDASHPVFSGANLQQRAFAPGGPAPQTHGTAVASLMIGRSERFTGVAPGSALYVADVYGVGPTGGSVDAIVRGLAWLGSLKLSAIDISLVGPPNRVLEAAVNALISRGVAVVAPVGNDGPAAPPMYPASYPGVIAVTAVDGRNRLLVEAGRASHVDFAAPGADMSAAALGGGFAPVRGTSFAAPIIAAKLALSMTGPASSQSAQSVEALGRTARKLGRAYGRGLVGIEERLASSDR